MKMDLVHHALRELIKRMYRMIFEHCVHQEATMETSLVKVLRTDYPALKITSTILKDRLFDTNVPRLITVQQEPLSLMKNS